MTNPETHIIRHSAHFNGNSVCHDDFIQPNVSLVEVTPSEDDILARIKADIAERNVVAVQFGSVPVGGEVEVAAA